MTRYTLTPQADLAVFYAADARRYAGTPVLAQVSLDVFRRFYGGFPSRGFACDGRPIGGALFDGKGTHLAVLPEHHGHWGRLWAPTLDWLFGLKPEMHIDIETDNQKALAFMERNGWRRMAGSPPGSVRFLMRAVPGRFRQRLPQVG